MRIKLEILAILIISAANGGTIMGNTDYVD